MEGLQAVLQELSELALAQDATRPDRLSNVVAAVQDASDRVAYDTKELLAQGGRAEFIDLLRIIPTPLHATVRAALGLPSKHASKTPLAHLEGHNPLRTFADAYQEAFDHARTLATPAGAAGAEAGSGSALSALTTKFAAFTRQANLGRQGAARLLGGQLYASKHYLTPQDRAHHRDDYLALYCAMARFAHELDEDPGQAAYWLQKALRAHTRLERPLDAPFLCLAITVLERLAGRERSVARGRDAEAYDILPSAQHRLALLNGWRCLLAAITIQPPTTPSGDDACLQAPDQQGCVAQLQRLPALALRLREVVQAAGLPESDVPDVPVMVREHCLARLRTIETHHGFCVDEYWPTPEFFSIMEQKLRAMAQGLSHHRQHVLLESQPGEGKTEAIRAWLSDLCQRSRDRSGEWPKKVWVSWPDRQTFASSLYAESALKTARYFRELADEARLVDGLVVVVLDEVQLLLAKGDSQRNFEDEKVCTEFLGYLDQSRLPPNILVVATTNDRHALADAALSRFQCLSYSAPRSVYQKIVAQMWNELGLPCDGALVRTFLSRPNQTEIGQTMFDFRPLSAALLAALPLRKASEQVTQAVRDFGSWSKCNMTLGFALLAAQSRHFGLADGLAARDGEPFFQSLAVRELDGSQTHFGWCDADQARTWQQFPQGRSWQKLSIALTEPYNGVMVTFLSDSFFPQHLLLNAKGKFDVVTTLSVGPWTPSASDAKPETMRVPYEEKPLTVLQTWKWSVQSEHDDLLLLPDPRQLAAHQRTKAGPYLLQYKTTVRFPSRDGSQADFNFLCANVSDFRAA